MIGTDYHIHTHYVGCANKGMTIPAILERCAAARRSSIAITDHCDHDWQFDKARIVRDELERTAPGPLEVFFGCEVNIRDLEASISLDAERRRAEGFEIVVGGVHSTWFRDGQPTVLEIIERQNALMCKAAANPLIDVLVHPWWFPRSEWDAQLAGRFTSMAMVPDELTCELAETCLRHATPVELNTAAIFLNSALSDEFKTSYIAYIARLVELGCSIALSTDAHDLRHIDSVEVGEAVLEDIGIPAAQVWRPAIKARVAGSRLNHKEKTEA